MHLPQKRIGALLALAFAAAAAQAQYKVVNPDGSVTYTDRPPTAANVRVTPMNRNTARAARAQEIALPIELRSVVQRHPVTLFATADCAPCDSGRKLLQQRGVPYSERRIATEEDAQALERLIGGRTVPALTIGAQPVRGWSEQDWQAFLDVAGYPKESRLPRGWQAPEATPLVERVPATARGPAQAPPPPEPAPAEPAAEEPAAQPGPRIRF
jgi:glutaredoxin